MDELKDLFPIFGNITSLLPSDLSSLTSLSTLSLLFKLYRGSSLYLLRNIYPSIRTFSSLIPASSASSTPSVVSVIILAVVLFISLKILGYLYNWVMFWVRMVFRLVFWAGVIVLSTWIIARGPEGALSDLQQVWRVWTGEWERFSTDQINSARNGIGGKDRESAGYFKHGRPGYYDQAREDQRRAQGQRNWWGA